MKFIFLPNVLLFTFILQVLLNACQPNSSVKKVEHPNSPEAVVLQWQTLIDENRFEEANQLSVSQALTYINELKDYTVLDSSTTENNIMLNLKCQVIGDSAYCTYHFADELGESDPGELALKKIKNRWFVSRTDFEIETNDPNQIQTDSIDEELE
jgi:hypothetical protein